MRERAHNQLSGALFLAIVLALAALLPVSAEARCGQIQLSKMDPVNWRGGGGRYDAFDTAQYVQPVEIRVRKKGGGRCRYAIGISEGSSGAFEPRELSRQGAKLAYNLYDSASMSNILMDMELGGAVISGEFRDVDAKREANTHTYFWVIPPQQIAPGTRRRYRDRLAFRLHEQVGGVYVQRHRRTKRHRARAARVVEVSLVDSGAYFEASDVSQRLDFGTLRSGDSLDFDLRARGNVSFEVSLQSQNRGVMAHTSLRSSVPYRLEVDGVPVNLRNGAPVLVASSSGDMTGPEGEVYRIAVTVGSLVRSLGGLHRDSITVTLTAQ